MMNVTEEKQHRDFATEVLSALLATDPTEKVTQVRALHCTGAVRAALLPCPGVPGRPARPELVAPKQLPRRRALSTQAGRFALLHALAHIEFNAINLALDALCRFVDLPVAYYHDWLQVAQEEAEHFVLLRGLLQAMGGDYGDLPAHDGLWEMAMDTATDPLERMALVPRVLEARGLDVTPAIRERLQEVGDSAAAAVLERIETDERGHVAIGSHWFRYLCEQRGLDAEQTFRQLLQERYRGRIQGPLALEARRAGGFSEQELLWLQECVAQNQRPVMGSAAEEKSAHV